jgi:hypothetical protein
MIVALPALAGPLAEAWGVLFDLAVEVPDGWAVAGSQMVIVHAAAHGVGRPLVTEDADVLVDVRELGTAEVAKWLRDRGFELQDVSVDSVGHRFRRGEVVIDVLAIDHSTSSDRTTVPPAHTIEVPGGRRAMTRLTRATISLEAERTASVPIPDWLGAVLLKARAVTEVPTQRQKHAQDLALLLSLPVDVRGWVGELAGRDRKHLRRARALLDDSAWRAVAGAVDTRLGLAALELLT